MPQWLDVEARGGLRAGRDLRAGGRLTRNGRALLAGLALAGLSLGPAFGTTLNVATFAESVDVFPKAFAPWDSFAIGDCLEGLLAEDAYGEAIPGQAQSWTISPDGLTYTFTLRPDALWSDGTAVTSSDFLTAFRWLVDPANAVEYANLQFPVRNAVAIAEGRLADVAQLGVTAPDEKTLVIELDQPTPHFLQALTHYSAYPIPSERFKQLGQNWLAPENIVCNGPFVLKEQATNRVRAVKSQTYYDRASVTIEAVNYFSITDLEDGLAAYARGDIDVFFDLPRQASPWLRAHKPEGVRAEPFLGVYYYALNQDLPALADPEVRRALSMAIDRDAIDPFDLRTPALSAYGWVPEGTAGYGHLPPIRPDWADWPMERRWQAARAVLEARGFNTQNPMTIILRYSTIIGDSHQQIAKAVADMWARIGVRAQLVSSEVEDHFNALRSGDFSAGRATWLLDVNDPSNVLDIMRSGNEYNFGHYSNPAFDALLDAAAAEGDLQVRAGILRQAEQLAVADTAAIPIYWFSVQNLVSPRIGCLPSNPKNVHRSRWIRKGDARTEQCDGMGGPAPDGGL